VDHPRQSLNCVEAAPVTLAVPPAEPSP